MQPIHRAYIWLGTLISLSWLSLCLIDPDPPGRYDAALLGYLFGSLFAHVTLSAAWMALGPVTFLARLIVSLGWLVALPIAVAINITLHLEPGEAVFTVGVGLVLQWLLLQAPLWGLALGFGLHLRYHILHAGESNAGQIRFGIRHLLIVMVVVGVLLGVGRLVIPFIDLSATGELPIFAFLAVAAVVLMLPLLLAALMRRYAVWGVLLTLQFIGGATVFELPIMEHFGTSGPDTEHFIAINIVSAAVILAATAVIRLHGYCLYTRISDSTANK